MFFSERFQISSELLKEYGAVDISLVCDIPLFIDPMLIFNSEKEIYKNLHMKKCREENVGLFAKDLSEKLKRMHSRN